MERLLTPLRDWFLPKEEYLQSFCDCDTRVEGWFKGEFLVLLRRMQQQGCIERFEREPSVLAPGGRKQVDFRIWLDGNDCICELKALCVSQAAGTPRNLAFYFRDDHVGLLRDFRKLDSLSVERKYVLGFIYPKPEKAVFQQAIARLPDDLQHWRCVTDPDEYPGHLFISLWKPNGWSGLPH